MRPKLVALGLLALISLVSPMIEKLVTGRVEMLSRFGMVETVVSLVVLFWWYHMDKREWNYRAGPLMNGGVLALAIVALPVYFIRSRGWKKGATTTALGLAFLAGTLLLGEAGEKLGEVLGS
jgi:RsiW-degrading membrane proteinase PrsW (M82 family)